MNTSRVEFLRSIIAYNEEQIKRMEEKHRGVRPSWVSSELGVLKYYTEGYKKELKELTDDQSELCTTGGIN